MTVKRQYGKDKIEVSGTMEQCSEYVEQWVQALKKDEPVVTACAYLRAKAVEHGVIGAKELSIQVIAQLLIEKLESMIQKKEPT